MNKEISPNFSVQIYIKQASDRFVYVLWHYNDRYRADFHFVQNQNNAFYLSFSFD